jgi:hypothetical protein
MVRQSIILTLLLANLEGVPASAQQGSQVLPGSSSRGRIFDVTSYGAKGDGTTDDSVAINAAIAAAGIRGGTVYFPGGTFALGSPLSGKYANIHFVGEAGSTTLLRLPVGANASFMTPDAGTYTGYAFEGIVFRGNAAACTDARLPQYSFNLSGGMDRLVFRECSFRDLIGYFALAGCRGARIVDCTFYGTTRGVMMAGSQEPPAVPEALPGRGLEIGISYDDIIIFNCRFHFCDMGIHVASSPRGPNRGLRVLDCSFRYDWWDAPYVNKRFIPTDFDVKTRVLTDVRGGFTGLFSDYEVISFRVDISSGTAFTGVFGNQVTAPKSPFAHARIGDVIETIDGRRAEITSVATPSSVWVAGWELIDTFEPTTAPALSTAWRLSRYYASAAKFRSDTTVTLYCDPVNVFTGERLVSDAGLNPVGLPARALAKAHYSGLHCNGGQEGLLVRGCDFRGSWADQCSIFDSPAPQVLGNRFEYGQDEGITCTRCDRAILADNTFRCAGTSAIFVGESNYAIIHTNTIISWALVNRHVLGAIEGCGLGLSIIGNTGTVLPGSKYGGGSACLINIYGSPHESSAGTIISSNVDGGARSATLNVGAGAAGKGIIIARDLLSISGPGASTIKIHPNANPIHGIAQ